MKKNLLMLACAIMTATALFAETTPAPEIILESVGYSNEYVHLYGFQEVCVFYYKVTATGEGDVHLYLNGDEVSNPCTIPQDFYDHNYDWDDRERFIWGDDYEFVATAQADGCEMSQTSKAFHVPSIPEAYLTYDEETESFWMSFYSNYEIGGHYRTAQMQFTEFITDCEPFMVWQAPQPITSGIYVDVWSYGNGDNILSSNMGIIWDLSDGITNFHIYRYGDYYDGIYYSYGYDSSSLPYSSPYYTRYDWMCNKYWDPSEHPACYSGEVVIPESIEDIVDNTFNNCTELTSVTIPTTVTYIGNQAFIGCTALDNVSISSIADWCSISFADTLSNPLYYADHLYVEGQELKDLVIEEGSAFAIKRYAFAGYKGLASITSHSVSPLNASVNAFYNLYDQVTLFVPAESLEAYQAHQEWGRFARIVPFIGAGPGDIDGSGGIDVDDVTSIIGMILDGEVPAYADVNGDGSADIDDITVIINMLLNGH